MADMTQKSPHVDEDSEQRSSSASIMGPSAPAMGAGDSSPPAPLRKAQSFFEPDQAARYGFIAEDIPYVDELSAALVRKPKRSAILLSLTVAAFMLVMLIWASFATLDEVTRAEGQVVTSQRTQVIQNLEGGILRAILVQEGQLVEKGDIVAQLDNELAASAFRDATGKAMEHALALVRLQAEAKGEEPQWPEDMAAWLSDLIGEEAGPKNLAQAESLRQNHIELFRSRMQQRKTEAELLDTQWQQRKLEAEELASRLKNTEASLQVAREQRGIATQLYQRGNYSRVEYLNLEKQVLALQTEVDSLRVALPRAQAAEQEAAQRTQYRLAEIDTEIAKEINTRFLELAAVKESLSAGGDRITRTDLRAPVRGTVNRIAISTLGGVVKPGEPIMEIVPLDDTLIVEARIRPQDVAFLHPGQNAMIKISAYDFSIYGGLEGTLEQISPNTVENRREESFYIAKIRTKNTAILYHNTQLPIIPGMVASVDILTGKKTVLDYMLKPLLKAKQNALRER